MFILSISYRNCLSGLVIILNNSVKNIGSFINENIQQDVFITFKGIILGHYESDSTKTNACFVIHLIFFLCKFYIHKCKFTNNKPYYIVLFFNKLKNYLIPFHCQKMRKQEELFHFAMTLICIL